MRYRLPFSGLQEKLFERLALDLIGTSVQNKIYDAPSDATDLPLVLIGDASLAVDTTKTIPVTTITHPVEIYTSEEGMEALQSLANNVSIAVTRSDLDLSSQQFKVFGTSLESCSLSREWDGVNIRRKALLVFKFRIQDTS